MKNNQKSVRLSDRAVKYIDNYRGGNFSERLENLVLDYEERQEQLVMTWQRLEAEIVQKRDEVQRIQERVQQLRTIDTRLKPLADAILTLLKI